MQIDADCTVINKSFQVKEEKLGFPLIRLYGLTQESNSVCLIIENFFPYFYVRKPPNFTSADIPGFAELLTETIAKSSRQAQYVREIEIVQKTNIFMYTDKLESFIKITLYSPKNVSLLRDLFEKGDINYRGILFDKTTFESKISFPLRFMIDRGIVGMSWVKVPKSKYRIVAQCEKSSTCQIEAWCSVNDLEPLSTIGEYSKVAPLRILSIDIECAAKEGRFPNADNDPVIQISNICIEFGSNNEPIVQKLFSYKQCADIVGVDVHSFDDEKTMLSEWRDFIIDLDPDIITGYNINMFDIPYLINRAERLKVKNFGYLSRIKNNISKVKHKSSKVKGFMNRDSIDINLEGRIILDMYTYVIREVKLRSYSLNNVSFQYLGEQKEDVHHSLISSLWEKNEYTRRRLAVYCMKDAYLPLKLAESLMTLYNYTEMCRVTSTPLNYILTRGQQIKVSSQLHKKALEKNYIIPTIRISKGAFDNDEEGFEGAFVLTPTIGFHEDPIVTLDFSSLYPSIMMAHNLCYSTLLKPGEEKNLKEEDYFRAPTGDCFVKEHIRKGILPIILEEIIAARKKAKGDLNKETDPFKKKVLNGRQLALKISANSVYGFTGAQVGQLPCLQISSSVTSVGRTMIEKTRDLVIEKYSKKNGFQYDSQVIYGDTDSVMIKFGVKTLHEAMILGKESSDFVTSHFQKPIKIEFEKVYYPYLLIKKKKYAGVIWTREDKYDKIDTKGLEAVRRDNCELVRVMVETVIKKILVDRSVDDAINYCKGLISDLLQNRIDISLLIISKSLSKKSEEETQSKPTKDEKSGNSNAFSQLGNNKNVVSKPSNKNTTYQAKQAHVELAEKMKKRDKGNAPNIGDRIQYVIIKGEKGSKNYENSEDPIYVLEHDLPLDINYYLENQIKKPLLRIFSPILSNPEMVLFSGAHTRVIYSGAGKGHSAFSKFVVVKKSCFNCKNVINSGVVCKNCKDKIRQLYLEKRLELNYSERLYADLWTQCQKCQGFLMQEIICQNRDCPIFYRRIKVKKDLKEIQSKIARFDEKYDW